MNTFKLTKCFACFCGFSHHKGERLPRKKKKLLKQFYNSLLLVRGESTFGFFIDDLNSCDLSLYYKNNKMDIIRFIKLYRKYSKELQILKLLCDDEGSEFTYKDGRLKWYWELDDDFSPSSGLMSFCYNEEDAGKTWAFSEVKRFIEKLPLDYRYDDKFVFPKEITSDKTLLKYIRNHSEGYKQYKEIYG